jgi:hypothetical protein
MAALRMTDFLAATDFVKAITDCGLDDDKIFEADDG